VSLDACGIVALAFKDDAVIASSLVLMVDALEAHSGGRATV
jgi:hypothetical protein